MPLVGNGLVAIWNDILDEKRDSFFEWHPREHMQERMGVPGFRRGRRYIAVEADIEFFTLYEASEPELLVSDVYRERLANPTEWSLSVLPSFRNNLRGVCRIESSAGYADGGFLATIRFEAAEGRDEETVAAAVSGALAGLVETPRVTGVHVARCDQQLSSGNQSLQRGRTISVPNLIVLVETSTLDAARDFVAGFDATLHEAGGANVKAGIYKLEYQVMNYASPA